MEDYKTLLFLLSVPFTCQNLIQGDIHDPTLPVPLLCNSLALVVGRLGNPLTVPVSITMLLHH